MTADRNIALMGKDLLAYCLHRKGSGQDAYKLVKTAPSVDMAPDRSLFLGQLCMRLEKWDEALEYFKLLTNECGLDPDLIRLASDNLLLIAGKYSEMKNWPKSIECLMAARSLCPENPTLEHVPEADPGIQPILMFQAGEYEKAIEYWEEELRNGRFSPETVHKLAIACQALLESGKDLEPGVRIGLLERANMYWTALSMQSQYWEDFFSQRTEVYNGQIDLNKFMEETPSAGLNRCDVRVQQLQQEFEAADDREALELMTGVRTSFELERQSAKLAMQLGKKGQFNHPAAGLNLLNMVLGIKKLDESLAVVKDKSIGSTGWLMSCLQDSASQDAAVWYLSGDYAACLNINNMTKDANALNIMGLAVINRVQAGIEGNNYEGCRELASKIPLIPNKSNRDKATSLLEEMAVNRMRTFLNNKQRDEAIEFLEGILNGLGSGQGKYKPKMPQLSESLAAALLQRGEAHYDNGNIDAWLKDYDRAVSLSSNSEIPDREFKKIVQFHLNNLYKKKDWRAANSFNEKLKSRYPRNGYVLGQYNFFKGLEKREKTGKGGDSQVVEWFRKAHEADPDNQEFKSLYSNALSNQAVDEVNDSLSGYSPSPYLVKSAVQSATLQLIRALDIDPSNEHAKSNLMELAKIAKDLDI